MKELLLNDAPGGINSLEQVLHEVEVLQALSRFNACRVVKLHAFYRSKDTAWLVLEYAPFCFAMFLLRNSLVVMSMRDKDRVSRASKSLPYDHDIWM